MNKIKFMTILIEYVLIALLIAKDAIMINQIVICVLMDWQNNYRNLVFYLIHI